MQQKRWIHIIPIATIMYIIAFINRANLSQALPSIGRDLHINALQAGAIAGIFYWGYILFEVPGGYLASHWSTKWFVSILLVLWGCCAVGCGLVRTWQQLRAMRLLLGVAESGMYPAALVLLSHWFPTKERARACACFLIAVPLSLVVSAPLSGWLLDRWNWRVMLIVEGAFPLLWLFVWIARIHDYPHQAPSISAAEREYLETEFRTDVAAREPLHREFFFRALLNPRVLILTLVNFTMLIGQLGYLFWLPSAIQQEKSISNFHAGILYAIPFIVGALAMVAFSYHSDQTQERRGHVATALIVGGVALIAGVLTSKHSPTLGYVLVCLAAIGAFAQLGPFWAIPTETFSRKMAGAVVGFMSGIGNLGGFFGPLFVGYLTKRTGNFEYGFIMLGAFMLVAAALSFALPDSRASLKIVDATVGVSSD